MTGAAGTRDKLLDAAARLFAERGIDNVSIAEIVRRAGQRNSSALHYHFGSRDAVLVALLERHIPDIRRRRLELLDAALAGPDDDTRAAAEAIVRPITEFAQLGWRERAYLQYGSELGQRLDRVAPEIRTLLQETSGYEAWDLLRARCPRLAKKIWLERVAICTAFIGRAAADRAAQLDRVEEHPVLSDDLFVDNLVDMVVGAMTATATMRSRPR
jgi:AcrR family transcriptional regulator